MKKLITMPASKFYEIMNEIFRNSGSGVDLMLEAEPGNDGPLVPPQDDLMEIAERLTGLIENNTQEIQQIKQFLASLGGQRNPQQNF